LAEPNLEHLIIRVASRDVFDGVGRILIKDFLKTYNVSREDFNKAIEHLKQTYEIRFPATEGLLLITLVPRDVTSRPYTTRGKIDIPEW